MTFEQFDNFKWHADMQCKFNGEIHDIASVDFDQRLVGLVEKEDTDEIKWVRCENISF